MTDVVPGVGDDPELVVPDVVGVVVGWRAWVVARSHDLEPTLVSSVERSPWSAGRAVLAHCPVHWHEAPDPTCRCGLYGVAAPGRMMNIEAGRGVIGCTALWGDVVEGAHGWRASHGYPQLLIVDPGVGVRSRTRLAERYGVPTYVSELPLPELVLLLDTVLRDRADGLRDGSVWWPDLSAEIRHEAAAARARRAITVPEATRPSARRGRFLGGRLLARPAR